ncbi:DciA family protein [Methylopila sp. M107]|uniref:DUF721 domain-containing protein n=1 Tax=Methylopila sp. M107 TaxID=1101190 RepID=UPI00037DD6C1|nr:DciA family protein [Methylopila sp. M107]
MIKPSRAKRLSDFLPQAIGPVAAKQGFANGEIVSRWPAIVGPEIAAMTSPQKLSVPPRAPSANPDAPPERATLTLRVEGAFALEIQHRAPEIIERVNAHLGWPCVGQVKIRQGAIPPREAASRRPALREPTAAETAAVAAATSGIEDEGLADAVARLGRAALAKSARR